ncbi:MAG: NlpC/P60 family protein [Chloroherpetonaceae bacterium]
MTDCRSLWVSLILFGLVLFVSACASTTSSVRFSAKPISKDEIKALEAEAEQEPDDDAVVDLLPPPKQFPANARERLENEMDKYLGVRYRYGGTGVAGMDCSGFVSRVFYDALNISLPRSSAAQAKVGVSVSKANLAFGDLVFFKIRRNRISHVGIYVGDNNFVHASTKLGVIVSNLDEPYYKRRYVVARRIGKF